MGRGKQAMHCVQVKITTEQSVQILEKKISQYSMDGSRQYNKKLRWKYAILTAIPARPRKKEA